MDTILEHLTPCLSLVAPSGMLRDEREDWLSAAALTLSEMLAPADLVQRACQSARQSTRVDHPSKIMPAINAAIEGSLKWRKDELRDAQENLAAAERSAITRRHCTGEEAAAICAEFGIAEVTSSPLDRRPLPTVEDYIAIGLAHEEATKVLAQQTADEERHWNDRLKSRRTTKG